MNISAYLEEMSLTTSQTTQAYQIETMKTRLQ